MEVNYLAPWAVSRAFAPVLAANGGGALVNMLSAASWRTNTRTPGYAASKAAEWVAHQRPAARPARAGNPGRGRPRRLRGHRRHQAPRRPHGERGGSSR